MKSAPGSQGLTVVTPACEENAAVTQALRLHDAAVAWGWWRKVSTLIPGGSHGDSSRTTLMSVC